MSTIPSANRDLFKVSQRAIIFNIDENILLLKFPKTDTQPGSWDFPGGHLDYNESCIEGIQREVQEETGLDIEIKCPVLTHRWKKTVVIFYAATSNNTSVTLSEEHENFRWVTLDEAKEMHLNHPKMIDNIKEAKSLLDYYKSIKKYL